MDKPTPRPHCELRIAHAEGYDIEVYNKSTDNWDPCPKPSWNEGYTYRVVPMHVEKKAQVYIDDFGYAALDCHTTIGQNVKFVFDSRTNELISVEKI